MELPVQDAQSQETMCDVVRRHARESPDAPVFLAEGREPLTYAGLADLMTRFSRALNGIGFGRGDRIAIVHPGGPNMASAMTCVWNCATAVPMNPAFTLSEFALQMRDLGVHAVAIDAGMDTPARDAAKQQGLPILDLKQADERIAGLIEIAGNPGGEAARPGRTEADDYAHILATSGTTSHSKVVPVRHRHLVARVTFGSSLLRMTPEDRCLTLMPLFHGGGISAPFCETLYAGASLLHMPAFSADLFFRLLATLQPSWYAGGPTYHHAIRAQAPKYRDAIAGAQLRFIRNGTGHLDAGIAEDLERLFNAPVIDNYSTTETGRICGRPEPPAPHKRGTVGISSGGEIAIMDPDGRHLPVGERGEVIVRGPHVFDGYENDPAANEAAFIGDWYRTGDEGVFDDDGFLTITGRIKDIISRGGEKIAPSEIDDALLRLAGVSEVATFPVPHATLGQEVAAAVVPEHGVDLSGEIVTEFLRGKLAPFKIPRRFVFVEEIPKSSAGKVQRRLLAESFGLVSGKPSLQSTSGEDDRSATPLEAKLQTIWAETLNIDQVGLNDDFFMLGGDSLQAVELFLRIEKELGRKLPRAVLFEAATVADMARRIEDVTPPRCIVTIQPNGRRPPFFCIHDRNGEVLNFRELSRLVGDEQPFYGIQSLGLDGSPVPFTTMKDMAAFYVREMQKVQPTGPYYVGGYSFGGRAALAIAHRLRALGEDVALLAILDTPSGIGRTTADADDWLARHWRSIRETGLVGLPGYLLVRVKNAAVLAYVVARFKILTAVWRYCVKRGRPMPRIFGRPVDTNDMISHHYRMEPYDGDATLFRSELRPLSHTDIYEGWRQLVTGKLEMRQISGEHNEILDPPHVQVLARELADCLEQAQAAARTPRPFAEAL